MLPFITTRSRDLDCRSYAYIWELPEAVISFLLARYTIGFAFIS